MSFEKRLRSLERIAAFATLNAPEVDYKSLLIARVEAVAARAEAAGLIPEYSGVDFEEDLRQTKEAIQEWLRREYGNLD